MDDYQEQADNFAKKYGITLRILQSDFREYFPGDMHKRYVFTCELERRSDIYTFTFGQSIEAMDDDPNMYDVLSCLTKNDPGSLTNFAQEYGYGNDHEGITLTTKDIYERVVDEWEAVEYLFSDILEELQEIQ